MSLLYYILYRALNNTYMNDRKLLFVIIQHLWLISTPMHIIQKLNECEVIEITFFARERIIFGLIGLITILIFDYIYYFREIAEKKILKKYTYKYKVIENNPILIFFTSFFTLLITWLILSFFIISL